MSDQSAHIYTLTYIYRKRERERERVENRCQNSKKGKMVVVLDIYWKVESADAERKRHEIAASQIIKLNKLLHYHSFQYQCFK